MFDYNKPFCLRKELNSKPESRIPMRLIGSYEDIFVILDGLGNIWKYDRTGRFHLSPISSSFNDADLVNIVEAPTNEISDWWKHSFQDRTRGNFIWEIFWCNENWLYGRVRINAQWHPCSWNHSGVWYKELEEKTIRYDLIPVSTKI